MLGLFGVALLGQFTLDRVAIETFGELDLRLVTFPALAAATLLWRFQPHHRDYRHPWPATPLWALALVAYLGLTAFWAPHSARVAENLADLAYLGVLIVLSVAVSAPDPRRARLIMLGAVYAAALVFALVGVVIGETDAQGRTVAFGGGPNVYVRVVLLGVIAAIALTAIYRRKVFLLATPLLVLAALLSASRGGTAAAVATGVVFAALTWRRWSPRLIGLTVVGTTCALALAWSLLPQSAAEIVYRRYVELPFEEDQLSGRPTLVSQALAIFLDDPVLGGGLDSYYARFGLGINLEYPHNLVLDLAATGGVVALALLAMFVVAVVRESRPAPAAMPTDQLAILLAACYLGAASLFSGELYDSRFLWIFGVLAINRTAFRDSGSHGAPSPVTAPRP